VFADPRYEEEVSGCTACVSLITDDKIYCVSFILAFWPFQLASDIRRLLAGY